MGKARSTTILTAAASGKTGLPLSDRDVAWDKTAAISSLKPAQYGDAAFWTDPDADTETQAAHKLWFAKDDGGLTAVWKGVTAAAGAVQGARGGVSIPDGDVAGVKSRIEGYYAAARKKFGDDGIKAPWEADEAVGQTEAFLLAYAEVDTAELDVFRSDDDKTPIGVGGSGTTMDEFLARVAFWQSELAMSGECSCGHMAIKHLGAENAGPCTMADCDCQSFDAKEPDSDDEAAAAHTIRLVAGDYARITDGLEPAHAALVRLRLANFDVVALPEEHQPGERLPAANPSPDAPTLPAHDGQVHWVAEFVPEGYLTDDGRAMAPDAIEWRDTPLTLMAMIETTEGGHIGAEICGRIDSVWRDDNYPGVQCMIRGSGVFESTEYAVMIAGLVDNKSLSGVSVDLAIHEYEVGPKSDYFDADGNWAPKEKTDDAPEPSIVDLLFGDESDEPSIFVVTKAVIGMVTVCPFAAFANTKIEIANSLVAAASPAVLTVTQQGGWVTVEKPKTHSGTGEPTEGVELPADGTPHLLAEGLTAAAAGLVPVKPPAEWFANPSLDELTALTVTDDGRVFGHAWAWDACHTGFQDVCVTPPHSQSDYAYFLLGEVECADGERIACGKITLDTGHADRRLGRADASAHYDNTGTVVADITVGEDAFGGWVAGALRPDVDADKARVLMAATLSGDWRQVSKEMEIGNLELIALLAVNVPGFPVPRARALVAAGTDEGPDVLSLVAAGVHKGLPERAELTVEQQARLDELLARTRVRREDMAAQFAALADRARGAEA